MLSIGFQINELSFNFTIIVPIFLSKQLCSIILVFFLPFHLKLHCTRAIYFINVILGCRFLKDIIRIVCTIYL
jgi:hypothetical protein